MTDLLLLNSLLPPGNAAWIAFDPFDLDLIDWSDDPATRHRVLDNAKRGWAATLWVGAGPLCCAGIADRHGGLGEAWTVIDAKRRHDHPLLLTRGIRKALDITAKSLGLNEIHLFVQFSQVGAMKWAKSLGFHPEGELTFHRHPERNHVIFCRGF